MQANVLINQTPTNQASLHGSNSSMLGAFDQNELTESADTILLPKLYTMDPISSKIDELALHSILDLAKHPASEILNLLATHSFASVNEFCRAVATNRAKILHFLSRIIAYNVAINEKITEQYMEWKKNTQV